MPRISGHERGEHGERRADAQRCALTEDEGVRPAEGLERRMRGEDLHLFKGAAEGADVFEGHGVLVCEGAWRCDTRCVAVEVKLLEGAPPVVKHVRGIGGTGTSDGALRPRSRTAVHQHPQRARKAQPHAPPHHLSPWACLRLPRCTAGR